MIKKFCCSCIAFLLLTATDSQGQVSDKMGPVFKAYTDSIRKAPYPYSFPIWGKKLRAKGFDLPLPIGLMLNSYAGSQEMNISNLSVGVNGSATVPLDFVQFGKVEANVKSITLRPDLWVLPFLDVYGIAGATWTQTEVNIKAPIAFSTKANFFGSTLGLGTTLAAAVHGFLTIVDINHAWTNMPEIDGAIQTTMFTPRLGRSFRFAKKPDRNITVWAGAPGVFLNRGTSGSISLSSIKPEGDSEALQKIVNESETWYQDLTKAQQKVIKTMAQGFLDKLSGRNFTDVAISYSLVKKPVSNWSMCIGGQYQVNRRWQMRSEIGFLGGRNSLLISGNYRFGL